MERKSLRTFFLILLSPGDAEKTARVDRTVALTAPLILTDVAAAQFADDRSEMAVVGERAMDKRVKPLQHHRTAAPGALAQEADQRTQTDLPRVAALPAIIRDGSDQEERTDAVRAEVEDLADVVQSEAYAGALVSDPGRPELLRQYGVVGEWTGVRRRHCGRRNVVIA